jgi:hypothetical protein
MPCNSLHRGLFPRGIRFFRLANPTTIFDILELIITVDLRLIGGGAVPLNNMVRYSIYIQDLPRIVQPNQTEYPMKRASIETGVSS